ncbi:hypothetical protein J7643_17150 [bacterium]|nr:hypothetical protein [bacterium]
MTATRLGMAVLGLVALAGCVYVPLGKVPLLASGQLATAGKATLQLTPKIAGGGYSAQAVVPAYASADVQHLLVQAFKVVGDAEVPIIDAAGNPIVQDVTRDELSKPITFAGLHPNTRYRFKAYAYKAASTVSDALISIDASSSLDVILPDESQQQADLPIQLKATPFDGQASPPFSIPDGLYETGTEGISTRSSSV